MMFPFVADAYCKGCSDQWPEDKTNQIEHSKKYPKADWYTEWNYEGCQGMIDQALIHGEAPLIKVEIS